MAGSTSSARLCLPISSSAQLEFPRYRSTRMSMRGKTTMKALGAGVGREQRGRVDLERVDQSGDGHRWSMSSSSSMAHRRRGGHQHRDATPHQVDDHDGSCPVLPTDTSGPSSARPTSPLHRLTSAATPRSPTTAPPPIQPSPCTARQEKPLLSFYVRTLGQIQFTPLQLVQPCLTL